MMEMIPYHNPRFLGRPGPRELSAGHFIAFVPALINRRFSPQKLMIADMGQSVMALRENRNNSTEYVVSALLVTKIGRRTR